VTLLLGLLVAGLLALLLLNTWTAQDAFRLQALQHKQSQLDDTEQTLRQQADTLTDPAKLAARAQALHMVPGGPPAFVRPDGTLIVGHGRVTGHRQGSLLIVTAVPSPAAPVVRSSPAATASPPAAHPSAAHPSAALHRP
jgi:hypothetical protein